jgi:hypothetical protein
MCENERGKRNGVSVGETGRGRGKEQVKGGQTGLMLEYYNSKSQPIRKNKKDC